jgi:phosphate/sulfate permease
MMWALLVGGVWQILASYLELNVSATHSIIGAIVGFSMVFKGRGAVIWAQEQLVCTGPMTGYNHDGRPGGDVMYFNGAPLAGVYTVAIDLLFNASNGTPRSYLNAGVLAAMTGLPIVAMPANGVANATWPGAVNPCYATSCYGVSSAGATFSANAGPYIVNDTAYPFGAVQFTIKSAGEPLSCSGTGCPLKPSAAAPIMPGQFYYASAGGYCTTASNGNLPFPPYKGVLIIVLSWFFSPVLTGFASAIIFLLSRTFVLRSVNSYKRSFLVLPPMAFLTFWVNIYFVFTKGAAKTLSASAEGWTTVRAAWIAAACAGAISFMSIVVVIPVLYHRINTIYQKRDEAELAAEAKAAEAESHDMEAAAATVDPAEGGEGAPASAEDGLESAPAAPAPSRAAVHMDKLRGYLAQARKAAMHGMEVNVHAIVEEDELVAAIHANAEVFDEKAETVFSYMQVFSAICVIFAHGAGEVGYMSGPLGAIFSVIRSGALLDKTSPPIWTVLVGALGLVIGLATYGYSVTRAIGTRMAKLTASRGFAAELSTSMIIMIAAQYGLPTSSSQCITGGIIGIALCEGKKGLNVKFLVQTFMSWIWTVVFVALITGFFFAQGAFAPCIQQSRTIGYYEESLVSRANLMLTNYQTMIGQHGYLTGGTANGDQFATYLATTISNTKSGQFYSYTKAPAGFYPGNKAPVIQSPAPWQMVGYLDTALALVQMSVMPNPTGVNMCGGNTNTTSNWNIVGSGQFPWSQRALSRTVTSPALADAYGRGPCASASAPTFPTKITLTQAVFLGPSPYAATANAFEDRNGNPSAGFNGTVARLQDPSRPAGYTAGTVTLDQVKNYKVCQQAPCNQAYEYTTAYMG